MITTLTQFGGGLFRRGFPVCSDRSSAGVYQRLLAPVFGFGSRRSRVVTHFLLLCRRAVNILCAAQPAALQPQCAM